MTTINATQVTIDTTATEVKLGEILLKADRRSTEAKPIPEDQRIRRVILPAGTWGALAGTIDGAAAQGLTDLLRNAMKDLGEKRLREVLEVDPMARTVPVADFTIPSLLAWNEETASSRGSVTFTKEQVSAWFNASATSASIATRHADKGAAGIKARQEKLSESFEKLANAKAHGIKTVEECDKLLALIHADDANHATVAEMVQRIAYIRKTIAAKKESEALSLDDI